MSQVLAIVRRENELRQAMLAADVDTLDRLIADDVVYVDPGGRVLTKQMDLEAHRSGQIRLHTFDLSETDIRVDGPVGIVVTRAGVAGVFAGQPFAGDYRFTRVWRESVGGWRIVAGHCCTIAP